MNELWLVLASLAGWSLALAGVCLGVTIQYRASKGRTPLPSVELPEAYEPEDEPARVKPDMRF